MDFIFTMYSGPQNAVRKFAYTTTLIAVVNYTIVMIACITIMHFTTS